jgi:hypothetical protein
MCIQINHKSVISNIQDPEARGTMIFAWWMACLSDAYSAAYYRRKPQVEDDDYDVDFYTVDPVSMDSDGPVKPDPREHLEVRSLISYSSLFDRSSSSFLSVLGMLPLRGDTAPVTM